ncbi:MAG: ribonuclease III [Propionibacteriaceae bacterium]|nr:ribonuclease III [Propionibacteriaceae bacterium]
MSRLSDRLDELGINVDSQLMDLAFTHRSWAYENGRGATNERLEFLGDAVLGAVVTEFIFHTYADRMEGQLARLRAAVVSGQTLAQCARELDLGTNLKLGKGEIATHGDTKDSILADAFEAVVGAIHLSGGFPATAVFMSSVLGPVIEDAASRGASLDWKSSLQELTAAMNLGIPVYTGDATGPDHERVFTAEVHIHDQVLGTGTATSRRGAEQHAAEIAYEALTASGQE